MDKPAENTNRINTPARVYVLCGPSGVGKGTVVAELCKRYPGSFFLSVSATTRHARPGEIDGEHYRFISDSAFKALIERGDMLEWAQVHYGNYYGTPRVPIEQALSKDLPVLLEIDLSGARQVRQTMSDAYFVFLAPPSLEQLKSRLIGRGTESEQEQEIRLKVALTELEAKDEFDQIVVNDSVDRAVEELAQIMGLA